MLTYRGSMTEKEKLEKLTQDFSMLPEEKQDYILGVLQALVFAHKTINKENAHSDSESCSESVCIE